MLAVPAGYVLWKKYQADLEKKKIEEKVDEKVELPVNPVDINTLDSRVINDDSPSKDDELPDSSVYYNMEAINESKK